MAHGIPREYEIKRLEGNDERFRGSLIQERNNLHIKRKKAVDWDEKKGNKRIRW